MLEYPAPAIPAGYEMAGDYELVAIELAHTGSEFADFTTAPTYQGAYRTDSAGRLVVRACDYEGWVDEKRAAGYHITADHETDVNTGTTGRPAAYWYERAKHAMAVLSASAQARLDGEQDRARRHAVADDIDDLRQVWELLDAVEKRGRFG